MLHCCYLLFFPSLATSACALLQTSLKALSTSFSVAPSPMHTLQGMRSCELRYHSVYAPCYTSAELPRVDTRSELPRRSGRPAPHSHTSAQLATDRGPYSNLSLQLHPKHHLASSCFRSAFSCRAASAFWAAPPIQATASASMRRSCRSRLCAVDAEASVGGPCCCGAIAAGRGPLQLAMIVSQIFTHPWVWP